MNKLASNKHSHSLPPQSLCSFPHYICLLSVNLCRTSEVVLLSKKHPLFLQKLSAFFLCFLCSVLQRTPNTKTPNIFMFYVCGI